MNNTTSPLTIQVDIADTTYIKASCQEMGLDYHLVTAFGPGGGCPLVRITGDETTLRGWFNKYYCDDEDIELYLVS